MWVQIKKLSLYRQQWFQFIIFVIKRFIQDRCSEQASSLTYTTLFAVVPMLTVFLVILSSIKALEPARQQLQTLIYSYFLPKTTIAFDQALSNFANKSSNLTIIGVLFLFVTTIMMIMSIETAFNRIWRANQVRNDVLGFMRYWTIISLGPLILGSAFALSSTIASFNFLNHNFGYEINENFLLGGLSSVLIFLGFFFLYWAVPNRHVPWKSAAYAAIFVTIIFELLKNFFGWAMSNFTSYEVVYGAFAAIPIFLLWIYLSWNIILLGVEISYAVTVFHVDYRTKRHPLFIMLSILNQCYQKQKNGESVKEQELLTLFTGKEISRAIIYLSFLEEQKLIRSFNGNEYILSRNLEKLNLYELLNVLPYHFPHIQEIRTLSFELYQEPWQEELQFKLLESHGYLQQHLAIPLAEFFDKSNYKKS